MNSMVKTLLIAGALAMASLGTPTSASADHNPYWRGYWGWYDNTYTPYHNHYPSYGTTYYTTPYYTTPYYTTPYYGGYSSPGPNVNIRLGRGGVRFGWW